MVSKLSVTIFDIIQKFVTHHCQYWKGHIKFKDFTEFHKLDKTSYKKDSELQRSYWCLATFKKYMIPVDFSDLDIII